MELKIITSIIQISGIIFIGWLAGYRGHITKDHLTSWSRVVVDYLFPLLAFYSITQGFKPSDIQTLWPLPAIGFGIMAFGGISGILFGKCLRSSSNDLRRTFHHICAVNNYGFLPIIIVANLWNDPGVAKLFLLNLGSNIGYWTIGVGMLGKSSAREKLKNLFSPSLIAIILALILAFTGLQVYIPETVMKIAHTAGNISVPLILILVGASMFPFPKISQPFDLVFLTVLRLIVLPLVCVLILFMLPIAEDVRDVALIVSLMPSSLSSTVMTRRFGGDPDFAVQTAIITTLCAIITVPIWMWVIHSFIFS